ncbi:MAG: hypothetical protein ACXVZX_02230 [Terriglobales bacterium]
MSGLGFDDFFPGVISSKTHSIIDYIHAGTNFAAAALFYKRGDSRAGHAAVALGASVLFNALMTDYEYGVFRVWSFKTHGILDYGVAAASASFPKLLDIEDSADAAYFYAQGGGETLIAGISDYNDDSGAKRHWRSAEQSYGRRRVA